MSTAQAGERPGRARAATSRPKRTGISAGRTGYNPPAMAVTQAEKAARFQALHERPGAFVIPNPWDAGSAKILASLGFEALTTTSAGLAFALGKRDGEVDREETLENARAIAGAVDLPVAGDLEGGYGASPESAAETIRLAAGAGLVGGSIEDRSADPRRIYAMDHAVERVAAAVEAARALPFPFVLVARAENFLEGRPDLDDTIRRLQAYASAGADVLYAPGLTTADQIRAVCSAVKKPVNVVMGLRSGHFSVAELAAMGVKRISVGSTLSRAALGALFRAGKEMRDRGTFRFAEDAPPFAELQELFGRE